MLLQGGPIGLAITVLLIFLSFLSWIIIFSKLFSLNSIQYKTEIFIKTFWESKSITEFDLKIKDFENTPVKEIFHSGFNEMVRLLQAREENANHTILQLDTVKRSISRQKMLEEARLSSKLTVLAISASAAPFIGLLGTVIGIIRAMHDIGTSGASSLAAVAPGISEALVATALGLFVAIPAVIFYNILVTKIRQQMVLIDTFSADFLNLLQRHYSTNS
ncbi:MAG: MotA/TolQ/ExbB proton channel family protein [Silvanigrellaceae bacterium]|nr:MotA/TolQ/ExbB proton channel family protein [Silvanigrellaceae bacterium]